MKWVIKGKSDKNRAKQVFKLKFVLSATFKQLIIIRIWLSQKWPCSIFVNGFSF